MVPIIFYVLAICTEFSPYTFYSKSSISYNSYNPSSCYSLLSKITEIYLFILITFLSLGP